MKEYLGAILGILIICVITFFISYFGFLFFMEDRSSPDQDQTFPSETELFVSEETEAETETERVICVPVPEIDEQLLTVNEWSRPGKPVKNLEHIVVHYIGNPKTSAQQNRDYFESLKDLQNVSMSANYVIGLEGEIIQCVPDDEVAYASNKENSTSISIENCHPDSTGMFYSDTYISLVKLVAYLTEKYGLGKEGIIRHYDVTGKDCPLYYVKNEAEWTVFLDDVMRYREAYENDPDGSFDEKELLKGLEKTYPSE